MASAPLRLRLSAPGTFTLLLVLLVFTIGCGHGHRHHHGHVVLRGTLEVYNLPSSRAIVDGVETRPAGSRVGDLRSVRATPGTGVFFDLPAALHDVLVFWDTGSRDMFFDVRVWHASTTTLDVRY